MDMPRSDVRPVDFDTFSTPKHLEHASEQARKRNYQDFLIVDVDSHHYENESYAEVFEYIENPVMRARRDASAAAARTGFLNTPGRLSEQRRPHHPPQAAARSRSRAPRKHRDIGMTLDWMDAMGVDYACLFPTPMLFLGAASAGPRSRSRCAQAYNRWLCERILAHEPRIVSMLYLPFNDPEAAYKTVKEFGDKKGVVGFMVTSPRYQPVHDNAYMKTYALHRGDGQAAVVPRRLQLGRPRAGDDATASSRCMRSASCGSTWST